MNKTWEPKTPPFIEFKKKTYKSIISTSSFIFQIGQSDELRKPSKTVPIKQITSREYQLKIAYLKTCLKKYREITGMGRGISAVQVGIPEKIGVVYLGLKKKKIITDKDLFIIINPKITKVSSTLLRYPEICMSANPLIAPVVRPSWVEFEYIDENGVKKYWSKKSSTPEGKMHNRVLQHEIDHMDGIINIDKVSSKDLIFESDPNFYTYAEFEKVTSK